jgi:molybdopterin converting factor subunit 1
MTPSLDDAIATPPLTMPFRGAERRARLFNGWYKAAMSMPVKIRYFAWLRERMGTAGEDLVLPDGVETVGALMDHLVASGPRHASALQNRRSLRCAVNEEFADFTAPVRPGDEVAFFPPVTGG